MRSGIIQVFVSLLLWVPLASQAGWFEELLTDKDDALKIDLTTSGHFVQDQYIMELKTAGAKFKEGQILALMVTREKNGDMILLRLDPEAPADLKAMLAGLDPVIATDGPVEAYSIGFTVTSITPEDNGERLNIECITRNKDKYQRWLIDQILIQK